MQFAIFLLSKERRTPSKGKRSEFWLLETLGKLKKGRRLREVERLFQRASGERGKTKKDDQRREEKRSLGSFGKQNLSFGFLTEEILPQKGLVRSPSPRKKREE